MNIKFFEIIKNIFFVSNYYRYFFRLLKEKISYIIGNYDTKTTYQYNLFVGNIICGHNSISNDDFYRKHLNLNQVEIDNLSKKTKDFIKSIEKEAVLENSMGGSANLTLLNNVCEFIKPKKVLETGIAQGYSTAVFLNYLSKVEGKLTSIDIPYMNIKNSRSKIGYLVPRYLQKYWIKIIQPDFYSLKRLVSDNIVFDLIHYDSDKSLKGKIINFELIWSLLKKGGYFICDDISDDGYFHYFANKKSLSPIVINFQNKFQGILIKN